MKAYKWLVCYILKQTADKVERLAKEGKDSFTIRNETQSYHAATLSVVYGEVTIDLRNNLYLFVLKKVTLAQLMEGSEKNNLPEGLCYLWVC